MEWEFEKQVHLTVLPRDGNSEAQLKLYSAPPGNDDTGLLSEKTPIGGTVYPALYITIGTGERIAGGTTQSVIRVHDTYTGYRAGTPVNSDALADLTSTNYWQTWNGTAWVTATVAPALTDNKNGSSPLKYRYLVGPWHTPTTPTRGNGPHTLTTTETIP